MSWLLGDGVGQLTSNLGGNLSNLTGTLKEYAKDLVTDLPEDEQEQQRGYGYSDADLAQLEEENRAQHEQLEKQARELGELRRQLATAEAQVATVTHEYQRIILEKETQIEDLRSSQHQSEDGSSSPPQPLQASSSIALSQTSSDAVALDQLQKRHEHDVECLRDLEAELVLLRQTEAKAAMEAQALREDKNRSSALKIELAQEKERVAQLEAEWLKQAAVLQAEIRAVGQQRDHMESELQRVQISEGREREQWQARVEGLGAQIKAGEEERERLKEAHSAVLKDHAVLMEECKFLRKQLHALEATAAEREHGGEDGGGDVRVLKAQLNEQLMLAAQHAGEMAAIKEELEGLKKIAEGERVRREQAEGEGEVEREKREKTEKEVGLEREKREGMERELEGERVRREDLEREVEGVREKARGLEEVVRRERGRREEVEWELQQERARGMREEERDRVEEMQRQMEALKGERDTLLATITQLETLTAKKEGQLERLRQHLLESEARHTQEALGREEEVQRLRGEVEERRREQAASMGNAKGWQDEVAELRMKLTNVGVERDALQARVSMLQAEVQQQASSLANLQLVLQAAQIEREEEMQLAVGSLKKEKTALVKELEEARASAEGAQREVVRLQGQVSAMARQHEGDGEKEETLRLLRAKVMALQEQQLESHERMAQLLTSTDKHYVDKRLIKNVLLAYLRASHKQDTLSLLAKILDMDDSEKMQAGLLPSRGGGGLLGFLPTISLAPPPPKTPAEVPFQSFTESFVGFLLEHSTNPSTVSARRASGDGQGIERSQTLAQPINSNSGDNDHSLRRIQSVPSARNDAPTPLEDILGSTR